MNEMQSKGTACRAPLALCAMLFALCASAPGCRTYYITVRPIGIVNNLQTDIPVTKTVSGSLPVSIIPK
jgi:hypothetical protein